MVALVRILCYRSVEGDVDLQRFVTGGSGARLSRFPRGRYPHDGGGQVLRFSAAAGPDSRPEDGRYVDGHHPSALLHRDYVDRPSAAGTQPTSCPGSRPLIITGIDRTIAGQACQTSRAEWLLEIAAAILSSRCDRLVDLQPTTSVESERHRNRKLVGVRHVVQSGRTTVSC